MSTTPSDVLAPARSLSIIVPTMNEADNVEPLLSSIKDVFGATEVEVVFVDDSTDKTPEKVKSAADKFPSLHVRLIHRPQRTGGLGGAVVAGLEAVQTPYACVMDGDLQHPPSMLPLMLQTALEKQADMVIATRRSENSQIKGFNQFRNLISLGLDALARLFFPVQLEGVTDPLTGFFLMRVSAIQTKILRPDGFKILLEILVRHPNLRKEEVPFHFGQRYANQSKASLREGLRYLRLLLKMRFGK